jgi:predicted nucleotidyltransferase
MLSAHTRIGYAWRQPSRAWRGDADIGAYTGPVDASPALAEIGRSLGEAKLEAVLIGNAAAALRGAPVTTIDFDFLFRRTARNIRKMKAVAAQLGGTVLRPFYPASDLFRIVRDDDGLQVDFMGTIHGIRSFEGVRDRASVIDIAGVPVLVASLDDVIRSKRAARRPRDLAVLEILEKSLAEAGKPAGKARRAPKRK